MRKSILLTTILPAFFIISANSAERKNVGYFSPGGVREAFASDVDMATINAISKDVVEESFRLATERGLRINLDLGHLITQSRPIQNLNVEYFTNAGQIASKQFAAHANNKLRDFLPDDVIRTTVAEYVKVIHPFSSALYSVFLVDEPYLNGTSKSELERVGNLVREVFAENGIKDLKLGVLFASALFNADFAERTQKAALEYVERIDRHLTSEERRISALHGDSKKAAKLAHDEWKEAITRYRLTTYDSAGNMFTGGGIPRGYDVVAFDFYLSTFLFDELYEDALAWLSDRTKSPSCDGIGSKRASVIRSELSFFQDGPMDAADHMRGGDDRLLDHLFNCRIGAVLQLLNEQLAEQALSNTEIMVVTESSSNGVLEFNSFAQAENDQPEMLIRKRVTDEVRRALDLLQYHENVDHILFFTFEDAYDYSINLKIGGVASIPEASSIISAAARRNSVKP